MKDYLGMQVFANFGAIRQNIPENEMGARLSSNLMCLYIEFFLFTDDLKIQIVS